MTPGSTTPVTSNLAVGQIYSTQITNRGNYEAPEDSFVRITGANLVSPSLNQIPIGNFKAGDASGNVCSTGGSVLSTSASDITSIELNRGATGNTVGVKYCLTSVPAGIASEAYTGSWTVGI